MPYKTSRSSYVRALALIAGASLIALATPALALSELRDEAQQTEPATPAPNAGQQVPLPGTDAPADEVEPQDEGQPVAPGTDQPSDDGAASPGPSTTHPQVDPTKPPPEIQYDLSKLPEPVRRMHQLIVEACKSGDLEKLRPLIGTGENQTQLSLGGIDGDPIAFIRELAGDDQGQEILAILEEVLEAGYVRLDAGTPDELYVWPYFFAVPLDSLTPPQRVELFRIVTAGDVEDMKSFGAYIFYRVGITPQGQWSFFVAGE